jgi:hypothetical protein
MTRPLVILVACLMLTSCAVKRRWRSSEQAYDRYWTKLCMKTHPASECDPNWKPEGK